MANLFGDTMPTLYTTGESTSLTLPVVDRDAKIQYFEKVTKTWLDGDGILQERIEGWRLRCSYEWSEITATNLDNIIQFMNSPEQKFIKFPTFPKSRKYPFIVEEFTPGLQYGYDVGDSARLVIVGTHIVQRFPSLDEMFVVVSPYHRILNTT